MGCVLIVEDYFESRDALRQLIEKDGRAVVTAGDGRDALERARGSPRPSLILLDLWMPKMTGWEFLQHKSADPTIAAIPTIVLSGSSTDLPEGAIGFLAKPVDIERLLALIDLYC
jgi:CheY-like chemotaxis protein